MTGPGSVMGALMAMGYATTRDQAQVWARRAVERGATPEQIAEAWAEWDDLTARSVHTIPAFAPLVCRCSHHASLHARGTGECWSAACGCASFRPREDAA